MARRTAEQITDRAIREAQKEQRATEAGEARLLIEKVAAIAQDLRRIDSRIESVAAQIKRAGIDPDDKKLAVKSMWNAGDKVQDLQAQVKNAVHFLQQAEKNE
jgi:hypothetical protein